MRPARLAFTLLLILTSGCAAHRPTGVYFVMVDRFANGDRTNDGDSDPNDPQGFHGGDLQGLIDHLDHIQSLGFDTVWLSPLFSMRTEKWHGYGAFHGYWTWDLSTLEPRFGDEAKLQRLRAELDRRHMKLVLDLVLNHVGPDAPVLQQHPDWFHHRGGVTNWNDADQLVMNDVHGLPDLATEKPEVFAHLLAATLKWKRLAQPDGFRLDAVKHLPLSFWAQFHAELKKSGDTILLGELLDGDPSEVARTWREGGFTSMFDFPLAFAISDVFCRGESPAKLAATLTNDRRYPDPAQLVTLVDNHDLPRLMSVCGGDVQKAKNALTFLLAMRGIPSLTWGTEEGSDGAKEPENRASMRFEPNHPLLTHLRTQMQQRTSSKALTDGAVAITEATAERVVFTRVTTDGTSRTITVDRGAISVSTTDAHADPALVTQWRTGAKKQKVTFTGEGQLIGSGPELGDWNPARAVPLPVTLELPEGGVFEFKRLLGGQWESGPNRVLLVPTQPSEVRF